MKQRPRGTFCLHRHISGGWYSEIPVCICIEENARWNEEYEGDCVEKQYYCTDENLYWKFL